MGGEEGDDGVGVGGGDGREECGGVEGTRVEEIGRLCGIRGGQQNDAYKYVVRSENEIIVILGGGAV